MRRHEQADRPKAAEQLLSVEAAAERLEHFQPRFIRRLIAERRIEFVKVGRHVRISESALADFIRSGQGPAANRRATCGSTRQRG